MNSQQAREKLDAEVDKVVIAAYERNEPEIERGPVMAAADVLMLAVHVEACLKKQAATDARGLRSCGVGDDPWYCAEGKRLQGGSAL